ncbi:MAG: hypothetical protein K0B15_11940 [Lentimicrobium sp.]|nr:hypothetical protein [Lentimicrobium sp.]
MNRLKDFLALLPNLVYPREQVQDWQWWELILIYGAGAFIIFMFSMAG